VGGVLAVSGHGRIAGMAAWAHLEITVDNEGNVEVGGYNADPEALVADTESWEDLLTSLGVNGWELVQVMPGVETTYWFKRQA
jgi:hypothetical protein